MQDDSLAGKDFPLKFSNSRCHFHSKNVADFFLATKKK